MKIRLLEDILFLITICSKGKSVCDDNFLSLKLKVGEEVCLNSLNYPT